MNYKIINFNKTEKSEEVQSSLNKMLKKAFFVNIDRDFIFNIGGDGSFLKVAKDYHNFDKKIIVNIPSGSLSFLESSSIEDLSKVITNTYFYNNFQVLKVKINNIEYFSLNELYIRSNYLHNFSLSINNTLFDNFYSSGLIFATIIGSSGVNRSNNGPLLLPNSKSIIISTIEPLNNKFYKTFPNAIIFNDNEKFQIKLNDKVKKCILVIDGDEEIILNKNDKIEIEVIESKANMLIDFSTESWIKRIREKLK